MTAIFVQHTFNSVLHELILGKLDVLYYQARVFFDEIFHNCPTNNFVKKQDFRSSPQLYWAQCNVREKIMENLRIFSDFFGAKVPGLLGLRPVQIDLPRSSGFFFESILARVMH